MQMYYLVYDNFQDHFHLASTCMRETRSSDLRSAVALDSTFPLESLLSGWGIYQTHALSRDEFFGWLCPCLILPPCWLLKCKYRDFVALLTSLRVGRCLARRFPSCSGRSFLAILIVYSCCQWMLLAYQNSQQSLSASNKVFHIISAKTSTGTVTTGLSDEPSMAQAPVQAQVQIMDPEVGQALQRLRITPLTPTLPHHRYIHLAPIPGKGQAYLATRAISRGERILEERLFCQATLALVDTESRLATLQ